MMGDPDVSARTDAQNGLNDDTTAQRGTRMRVLRWAVNCWLIFHLLAVVIAPAAVAPTSALIQSTWGLFGPYIDFMFLNHGYHFFAPEPTESTLLSFEAERADGTVARGRLPSREIVPRLLYHRHFMLTEHLGDTLREAPEEMQKEWLASYAEHLCRKYGAKRVKLTGQIHNLATMDEIRDGKQLNDPASYESEELGVFECQVH